MAGASSHSHISNSLSQDEFSHSHISNSHSQDEISLSQDEFSQSDYNYSLSQDDDSHSQASNSLSQDDDRKLLEQRETKRRDERKTNMKVVGTLVAALAVVTFAFYVKSMEKLNEEVSKITKNVEDSIEDFIRVAKKYDAEDLIERVKRLISMEVVFRVHVDDSGVCIPDNRYPQFERKITEFDEEMMNCISELKKRAIYKVVVDTAVSQCVII